jgi:hypothetical protein
MSSKDPSRTGDKSSANQKAPKTAPRPDSEKSPVSGPGLWIQGARPPQQMAPGDVLQLQRTVGNRAVGTLIPKTAPGSSHSVIQRVAEDEVSRETASDKTFASQYPAWLKKTQAMTGLSTAEILAAFSLDKLKDSVSRYTIHSGNAQKMKQAIWGEASWFQKFRSNEGEVAVAKITEHYAAYLVEGLTASATLKKYAGDKLGKNEDALRALINKALKVVDEAVFEKIYLDTVKGRGLDVQTDYLPTVDTTKGFRAGEAFYLRLGTGTPADSLHSPIHEFMHFLSDPAIKNFLGPDLNEGVTENITIVVMGEAHAKTKNDIFDLQAPAYGDERAEVQKLMSAKSISQADLIQAYFHALQARAGLLDDITAYRAGPAAPGSAPASSPAVAVSSSPSGSHPGGLKP